MAEILFLEKIRIQDGAGNDITSTLVSGKQALDVNLASGNISVQVSDVQIGAVELKDAATDVRAQISADGANTAIFVQSNSLAKEATLISLGTLLDAIRTTDGIKKIVDDVNSKIKGASGDIITSTDIAGKKALDVNLAGGSVSVSGSEQYPNQEDFDGTEKGNILLGLESAGLKLRILKVLSDGSLVVSGFEPSTESIKVREVDNVIRKKLVVTAINNVILSSSYQTSTSLDAGNYGQATAYIKYTKGLEDSFEFKFQFSHDGVTWYEQTIEFLGSPTNIAFKEYQLTNSANFRLFVPMSDMKVRVSVKGTGASVTGQVSVDLVLGWS